VPPRGEWQLQQALFLAADSDHVALK
jgi:hypothetical protein